MKVIMTGGGTGGHIYPAIAIAEEIKRRVLQMRRSFLWERITAWKKISFPGTVIELKSTTVSGLNREKTLEKCSDGKRSEKRNE